MKKIQKNWYKFNSLPVTHRASQWCAQFLGDTRRHAAGGDSAWLDMADHPSCSEAARQTELRQPSHLAGTSFAADHDQGIGAGGGGDALALPIEGQVSKWTRFNGGKIEWGLVVGLQTGEHISSCRQRAFGVMSAPGQGRPRPVTSRPESILDVPSIV